MFSRDFFLLTKMNRKSIILSNKKNKNNIVNIGKIIGKGSYGTVYDVIFDGEPLALKVVDKSRFDLNSKVVTEEIKIIQKLTQVYPKCKGSDNLLCYKDVYEDDKYIYFISDKMRNNLMEYLESDEFLSLDLCERIDSIWNMMNQILEGLNALHQAGIVHRDIKFENILTQDKDDKLELKISDFGLSCFQEECSFGSGTDLFLPPQSIFAKQKQTFRDDFYGLAVILFSLIMNEQFVSFDMDELIANFQDKDITYETVKNVYNQNYQDQIEKLDQFFLNETNTCNQETKVKLTKMINMIKYVLEPENINITLQEIKNKLK